MSSRPLALTVEESDGTLVLTLAGEFDLTGVGPVENALDRMGAPPVPERLVFDLRHLDYLDLAGLRTILRANARGRREGFQVFVVRPGGIARRVFTLTRAGEELRMVGGLHEVGAWANMCSCDVRLDPPRRPRRLLRLR